MKPYSRAYNRNVSWKKAIRKKKIAENVYFDEKNYPYYNNLHQYSKNKIHCSCPICSAKTKDYDKHSDAKRKEAMDLNWWYEELEGFYSD